MDIQVILYVLIAALIATIYGLRRVILLERSILRIEQAIFRVEQHLTKNKTVKKKRK